MNKWNGFLQDILKIKIKKNGGLMSWEFNAKSVYGVLFVMLNDLKNQSFLFKKVFTYKFLRDVTDNPKSACLLLNELIRDIEDGKNDKVTKLLRPYRDKLNMMISMLMNYGSF